MGVDVTESAASGLERRHALTRTDVAGSVPALFVHGFGTSQEMWRRLLPELAGERSMLLMDHVGAGSSDLSAYDPRRYQSLTGYADDVVTLLDELGTGPVDVVGHSAGSMIGALVAVQRPDLVASLSMIGGSPRYLDDEGYVGGFTQEAIEDLIGAMQANFIGWSRSLAPVVMANPERPELAEELAASFAHTAASIAVDFARAIFLSDFRDVLPRIAVPTLVVQAADDPMVPEAVGRYLHESIPGSRLELLQATGHFPHVSGPEETASILSDFLAQRPRP
jgi:sigma-B regulation protein RsbQ